MTDSRSATQAFVFEMKGQAAALREQARKSGTALSHSQALEVVAQLNGFRDWNAAAAARSTGKAAAGDANRASPTRPATLSKVQLDLKNSAEATPAMVAALLASVDDDRHWQLRVTKDGIAYLSDVAGNSDLDSLAFRLETWCAGCGDVGPQAAADELWVLSVYRDLVENWPDPKSALIDW
ncbi:glyoxalase superfamily protein [Eleftheria terrae]|uniref:glyoxalase superfamily protein n=1 Tax=Eleftheria terrae TaxID=1597781 RepID=UPI00263B88F7|nr:glyoxalase superfamily protein [Eleftheria terrae]WKB50752.1 glyoxalase superfamily protein [Eleftheria terrae]